MSAYIVDRNHIQYLVRMAVSRPILRGSNAFRWYFTGGRQSGETQEMYDGDYQRMAEVANMLWTENATSVLHRYPQDTLQSAPGPIGEDYKIEAHEFASCTWEFDAVQVLKAANCFIYQTCEHPEWEKSEAFAFVQALKEAAIGALPGYDKAEWGVPNYERPCRLRQRTA